MLTYRRPPPVTVGGQQTDAPPPVGGREPAAGDIVQESLSVVRVEIGGGAQQQALAAAGRTGKADTLTATDVQVDGTQQWGL
jgi:hypothetical protein